MKRDGLVTTENDRNNKRLVNIKLTDKGRKALSKAMPCARGIIDQVMSSLTEVDAVIMKEKLKILRENAYDGLENIARYS
jgi:DNA-binding MarR family transcriptional regulator